MNKASDKNIILISGPVRSGKSRWAENILANDSSVTYIATYINDNNDESWQKRIQLHKARRPSNWKLIENFTQITEIFSLEANEDSLLIDSLGGIVFRYINLPDLDWSIQLNLFLECILSYPNTIVIVSEEVGWGLSPSTEVSNLFRDRLGELTDNIDKISTNSWLVVRGRAIDLRRISFKVP